MPVVFKLSAVYMMRYTDIDAGQFRLYNVA